MARHRPLQRKARHGYSWYETLDHTGTAYLRGSLNTTRAPGWIDAEMMSMLPRQIAWPSTDIAGAHELVDHLVYLRVGDVQSLQRAFPEHTFGFEERWLPWATAKLYPTDPEARDGAKKLIPTEEEVIKKDHLLKRRIEQHRNIEFDIYIVRTKLEESWAQIIFHAEQIVLTKAWVDLPTQEATVYEHHRGRWAALNVSPEVVADILGRGCFQA